ncbi:E3 ubiquitin-protein ligase WAV3 [Bienertia sinuspersici]
MDNNLKETEDDKFNDDDKVIAEDDSDAPKVRLQNFENEAEVPPEAATYQVLLEATTEGGNNRLGADIVMLLDVTKLNKEDDMWKEMQKATQFVIRKLSPNDRLSIITYSTTFAERKCPLWLMTPEAKKRAIDLTWEGEDDEPSYDNVSGGLKLALKVLDDREHKIGRSDAIMLLSSGMYGDDGNGLDQIEVDRYPIFTFLYGTTDKDCNPKPLHDIAKNSDGGTFSLAKPGNLCVAFSQCLGGLLSVVVEDVKLVIKPLSGTKVEKVYSGLYQQSENNGIITISFGNLYRKEIRKVLVNLSLPRAVNKKQATINTLEIKLSRRIMVGESDATKVEIKCMEITELIKEAKNLADNNKMDEALDMIVYGQCSLDDIELEKPNNPVMETLKIELAAMVRRNENIRIYATPRMDAYLEQVKVFDSDQTKLLPTAAEDELQELAEDRLADIATTFEYNYKIINTALKNIQRVINLKA